MKKFYSRFRVLLMTFALGLASVFVFNGSLKNSDEVFVNLPKVESDEVIVLFPRYENEIPRGGGSACGGFLKYEKSEKRDFHRKRRDVNVKVGQSRKMQVDMSPAAIKNRLKLVSQLWRLSISLEKAKKETDRKRKTKSAMVSEKTD